VSNATQRPGQLLWLLEQIASPWLQAAYDYSHAQGKRGFLLPGEGTTDYMSLFKLVAASPYRGDVLVEVSSQVSSQPAYDPLAAASQCYNRLADAVSKAGVKRG
jgi:sugar phosphate isomerase/epimerase